jgi:hypothetical protein
MSKEIRKKQGLTSKSVFTYHKNVHLGQDHKNKVIKLLNGLTSYVKIDKS